MISNGKIQSSPEIVIRDIGGQAEYRRVEELQRSVWGLPDIDVVPLTQLVAAKAAGGVVIGAFDGELMVGFAYGFAGFEHGEVTHHSHMLAVMSEYRSFNIGYLLKLKQREKVFEQGIEKMTWTYDPLQSMNAHFNFHKLGVTSDKYLINFYGEDAASFLHHNGTDRLWVTWLLSSRRVRKNGGAEEVNVEPKVPMVAVGINERPIRTDLNICFSNVDVTIEIPADVNKVQQRDSGLAAEWREATRWAFTEALGVGYTVVGFDRQRRGDGSVGVYNLVRRSADSVDNATGLNL